ncbi:MAG: OB-fold nucleic acid binding domain-containing protein [Phycisphaerales bacterium]|nr:OB-fold nucleic acid binding domain-containing protein [Phycisphaerales bacterium]
MCGRFLLTSPGNLVQVLFRLDEVPDLSPRYNIAPTQEVAGVVLVRQRPHTARGMTFMTLEDETGTANIVVTPKVYEAFRSLVRGASVLLVWGWVQRSAGGAVVHLRASQLASIDDRVRVDNPVYEWT